MVRPSMMGTLAPQKKEAAKKKKERKKLRSQPRNKDHLSGPLCPPRPGKVSTQTAEVADRAASGARAIWAGVPTHLPGLSAPAPRASDRRAPKVRRVLEPAAAQQGEAVMTERGRRAPAQLTHGARAAFSSTRSRRFLRLLEFLSTHKD